VRKIACHERALSAIRSSSPQKLTAVWLRRQRCLSSESELRRRPASAFLPLELWASRLRHMPQLVATYRSRPDAKTARRSGQGLDRELLAARRREQGQDSHDSRLFIVVHYLRLRAWSCLLIALGLPSRIGSPKLTGSAGCRPPYGADLAQPLQPARPCQPMGVDLPRPAAHAGHDDASHRLTSRRSSGTQGHPPTTRSVKWPEDRVDLSGQGRRGPQTNPRLCREHRSAFSFRVVTLKPRLVNILAAFAAHENDGRNIRLRLSFGRLLRNLLAARQDALMAEFKWPCRRRIAREEARNVSTTIAMSRP